MLAALGMLLFRYLPASRQQIIEKAVETGELILDPFDPAYPKEKLGVIEP